MFTVATISVISSPTFGVPDGKVPCHWMNCVVVDVIQWQGTFPSGTPNVGDEITEIQATVNTTNPAVFQLNSINDPATWSNSGAITAGLVQASSSLHSRVQRPTSTQTKLQRLRQTSAQDSIYLYGTNSLDNFPFTLSGTFDFGAATVTTNCLSVQLQVYILNPAGTITTLTNHSHCSIRLCLLNTKQVSQEFCQRPWGLAIPPFFFRSDLQNITAKASLIPLLFAPFFGVFDFSAIKLFCLPVLTTTKIPQYLSLPSC